MPRGSGQDAGGSRNEHYHIFLGRPEHTKSLGAVLDLIHQGRVPPQAAEAILLSRIMGFRKPGSKRLRPIGAPTVLRNMGERAACKRHAKTITAAVGSRQFGVGRKGGVEQAIHTARALAEVRPSLVWLGLDARNAFTEMRRDAMVAAVEENAPEMAPYARLTLNRRSRYWYQLADGSWVDLYAEEGTDQGGPLSPAIFCIGLRPALERIESRLRARAEEKGEDPNEICLIAYIDDILLGAPPALVRDAVKIAEEELAELGLKLALAKTTAWSAAEPPSELRKWLDAQEGADGKGWWRGEGFRLLGAPLSGANEWALGTPSFTARFLSEKVDTSLSLIDKAAHIPSLADPEFSAAQICMTLLRLCGNAQLVHLLRTTPPEDTLEDAERFDQGVLQAAETIAEFDPLSKGQEVQLRLPMRLGGFGLPAMAELAAPAWVGSWLQNLSSVITCGGPLLSGLGTELQHALTTTLRICEASIAARGVSLWEKVAHGEGSWEGVSQEPIHKGQRHIQLALAKQKREELLQAADEVAAARIRSSGGPGAAAWLNTLPTAPELTLSDEQFRIACRMRIGQKLTKGTLRCERKSKKGKRCGEHLDPEANHAHLCAYGGGRMARHDGQKRTIARIMRRHHIAVEEEVRVPEWDRPNPRRNSDTDEWLRARLDLAFPEGTYADVRVTHPTAQSHLHDAAKNDGAAALEGEKAKRARYGRGVIPIVVETHGRWGPTALRWWRQTAKNVAAMDPEFSGRGKWAISGMLAQWWAETSVALQRANAKAVRAARGVEHEITGGGGQDSYEGPTADELMLPSIGEP